jgi:hypothetical protein
MLKQKLEIVRRMMMMMMMVVIKIQLLLVVVVVVVFGRSVYNLWLEINYLKQQIVAECAAEILFIFKKKRK